MDNSLFVCFTLRILHKMFVRVDVTPYTKARIPSVLSLFSSMTSGQSMSSRGDKRTFFKSEDDKSANSWAHSAIANPQIPVRKSQILKFLWLTRRSQIRKFLWLIRRSQIRKFLQNTAILCLTSVPKVVYSKIFYYVQIWIRVCICGLAEVSSTRITKKIGSANRKSGKRHICESPQI
jgi:hypothetical protein